MKNTNLHLLIPLAAFSALVVLVSLAVYVYGCDYLIGRPHIGDDQYVYLICGNNVSYQSYLVIRWGLLFLAGAAMMTLLGTVWRLAIRTRRNSVTSGRYCENCGYDLRASPVRCPECGRNVAPRQ
jgi:hypothetical protein